MLAVMAELPPTQAPAGAAFLEVRDGAAARRILLGDGAITIGADAGCDVVIDHPWIAPRHARLDVIAGAHHVIALGGAHVSLGGAEVTDAVLHDGDLVRLQDPATAHLVTLVYRNPLAPRIAPVQHFATPPGTPLLTIGRADADLVLDQPLVSRHHAALTWEGDHHVLHDRGSANGTWLNGRRVQGAARLAPGDVVAIGTFRLTYDGDSLDSFDQRGAIRIDATAVERRIGDRVLLAPTTLSIEPCELVAIIGASGAGKSTLMTALCGFARATAGRITVNGDDLYAGYDAYRTAIGFVPQDDILHRTLPVGRALHHAARLRLPADTTPDELAARIAAVLEAVDMTDHAGQRIDRLSGGQRKRVSIACELLADPVLMFLDEPTSGLDPGLERKLMYTLRRLADRGRTIVLITHATQNIAACDHIAFLSAGRLVYFGPPSQALGFFGVEDFADVYTVTDGAAAAAAWEAKYQGSLQHQKYAVERPARAPAAPSKEQRGENERRRGAAQSWWRQLAVLCRRYFELIRADRKNLALLLAQAPIIGLLLVLVSPADALTAARIEAKKLVFMLATTGVWFGVINSAREICKEAHVLRRERLAGLQPGPYLGSKLAGMLALVAIQSALLLGVVGAALELPARGVLAPAAVELYVTIVLAGAAGIALGLCISAVASMPDKATSLIPIVLVPQVIFAGVMFALTGPMAAFSRIVSARAAVDAMSAVADTNGLWVPPFLPLPPEPASAHTPSALLSAWAILVAQAVGFCVLAWLMLRRRREGQGSQNG
jgi:ABC-type multidrug transport system ATPase subunit